MFRGYSYHTIDNKGRIIIPARFRDIIKANGGDCVMVSRMDNCLVGYPLEAWRNIESKILSMAEKSGNIRRFRRVFIGGRLGLQLRQTGSHFSSPGTAGVCRFRKRYRSGRSSRPLRDLVPGKLGSGKYGFRKRHAKGGGQKRDCQVRNLNR